MNPEALSRNEKIDKFLMDFATLCLEKEIDCDQMVAAIYSILTFSYLESNLNKLKFLKDCGDAFDHYKTQYVSYDAED